MRRDRARTLVAVATLAGLVSVTGPAPSAAAASPPVNHVLGDASFAWRYGRLPTAADAEVLRIRTHLDLVGRLHRARPDASVPADQRDRREVLLGALSDYRDSEAFPTNATDAARTPVFVDANGQPGDGAPVPGCFPNDPVVAKNHPRLAIVRMSLDDID